MTTLDLVIEFLPLFACWAVILVLVLVAFLRG